jgi:hypothetical protein
MTDLWHSQPLLAVEVLWEKKLVADKTFTLPMTHNLAAKKANLPKDFIPLSTLLPTLKQHCRVQPEWYQMGTHDWLCGFTADEVARELGLRATKANARRQCDNENTGCNSLSASKLDSDTVVISCLNCSACENGIRNAEGIMCNMSNDMDDRTWSEDGLVVHCRAIQVGKKKILGSATTHNDNESIVRWKGENQE